MSTLAPLLPVGVGAPSRTASLLRRPHLEARLDRIFEAGVGLVSAGPGYGKTTLLGSWVDALSPPPDTAWLTIVPEHEDPTLLGEHLALAFRATLPDLPSRGLREVLGALALATAKRDRPLLLILDDAHAVRNPRVSGALTALVDRRPAGLFLVLTGRSDPPGPWPLLRARGGLVELRSKDLAFETDEAMALLERAFGLTLPRDRVAELNRRTEGWVAGLCLAGLAMRDADDPVKVLDAGLARHRYVRDYLEEEVLLALPADVLEFLQRTSVLERLDPRLCDVLTGRTDSLELLEGLVARSLFTEELAADPPLFRYHALLAERLRARMHATRPELVTDLSAAASRWYEERGEADQAIELALRAKDTERAAALIRSACGPAIRYGYSATVLRWLRSLPEDLVAASPELLLILGRTGGQMGDATTAAAALRTASAMRTDTPGSRSIGVRIGAAHLQTALHLWVGELESVHASASEALTLLEGHPSGSELEVLAIDPELLRASEAGGLMLLGRFEEAVQRIDAMLEPTRLARPTRSTIRALGVRALALAWSGSPRASAAAREGQHVLRSFPGTATESLTLHVASAWVEKGPEAEAALESAVAIQTSVDFLYMRVFTELAAARLHLRRGRWALAERALEAAEEAIAGLREPAILPDLAKALRAEFDERAPAETLGELSAREIEILTAIADGATRSEAARQLHLSVNTVKTYLRTAYRKLGATDRDNAVASARALGLIGEAPQPEDRPGP